MLHVTGTSHTSRPLVFDCPHAGRTYPADFDYSCPQLLLERAEDRYMDKMLDWADKAQIPLLIADFPRTYIDVNRAEDELDPLMLSENWPGDTIETEMTLAGIGLIRRMLTPAMPLSEQPLSIAQTRHRIEKYYQPYHARLAALINDCWQRHGHVLHINWHSMPSRFNNGQRMPDFVLGNRYGRSCAPDILEAGLNYLRREGFNVRVNDPYPGQEVVRRTGQPEQGRHAIQVEINKALYLDENKNMLNANHVKLRQTLSGLTDHMEEQLLLRGIPLAAD